MREGGPVSCQSLLAFTQPVDCDGMRGRQDRITLSGGVASMDEAAYMYMHMDLCMYICMYVVLT